MALNALTLAVTSGVQGKQFQSAINGLTTGKVEVLNDGSPGFSTVNGQLISHGLPYPVSTVVLREYEPGVGQGYRDTRIDITAATEGQIYNQALALLSPGRTLVRYRTGGERQSDGSIVFRVYAEDELGATLSAVVAGLPPIPIDLNGYYFASTRLRTPLSQAAVPAGSEYRIDVCEFYSPPYPTNNYRFSLPGHFSDSNQTPVENDMANPFNIEGMRVLAFISGSWQSVVCNLNGQAAFTVNPGDGELTDDAVFGQSVPANTRMQVRIASYVQPGQSMIGGLIPSQAGALVSPMRTVASVEWAVVGSTSQASQLTANTKPTGTDGRVGGSAIYTPSFAVAKAVGGLPRPVIWHSGDSKTWGKNENETYLATRYLSAGFAARAFDDDDTSQRLAAYMMSIPGMGILSLSPRTAGPRKFNLIRKVPNRPYTHITTDHYNNGGLDASYRATFSAYYDVLLAESRFWGNTSAPLYQFRVIPKAGSWATTLGGQNPGADSLVNGIRWQFDADLVAGNIFTQLSGVIDTNTDYAYDQSTNRDKVAIPSRTYTLAADYTASATSIQVNELPQHDDSLVIDPTKSNGRAFIRSWTGSGPYTCTIFPGVPTARSAGYVVPTSNVGDNVGLHPSPQGHKVIAGTAIPWKSTLVMPT
ncbi:hypothetical protein [Sphingobium sp. CCH11-B1]|uniref:hypothetical protein n=1 Tax=Sphingobium sp. CCH11-B1 TaxID=1768781 RepID=UPI00082D5108|nr:hypothetical protein [Sphingobium sp. CCH11-B1]